MSPISCREQTPACVILPEFQRADLNRCWSGKGGGGGEQDQGRNSPETIVQPWGRIMLLPQGIQLTMSLSSAWNKNPTNGRCKHCFDHLMRRTDSLEKTLMLGKIEGRRGRG